MHERSLVQALLEQVDQIRRRHDSPRVTEVRVEIGPLSGIEPALLASAFEEIASNNPGGPERLMIDEVPLLAACKACHYEFQVCDFEFRCPRCAGPVQVIRGDTVMLVSVTMETGASSPDDPQQQPSTANNRLPPAVDLDRVPESPA